MSDAAGGAEERASAVDGGAVEFRLDAPFLAGRRLRALLDALGAEGVARVVGGAVRNTILKKPIGDIDIATTLLPERVAALARAAGFGVHETGLTHGTLTIVVRGAPFEVTTLREDVSTDGRRATVRFTEDWAADAHRRDFTMNALYLGADGVGHDFVGGYRDCRDGRVRFIGDAHSRIREDHLRILRFFRFYAAYGVGPMDEAAVGAVVEDRRLLASLPAERILAELEKLVVAARAVETVDFIVRHDILGAVLDMPLSADGFAALGNAAGALSRPADAALGFLALVGFDAGAFGRLADRLRFSRKLRARGLAAVETAALMPPATAEEARALLYAHGAEAFADGLVVAWAKGRAADEPGALLAMAADWARPHFPVNGNDLLRQGGAKGPALGARLERLERAWIASDFTLDRAALLALDREGGFGST